MKTLGGLLPVDVILRRVRDQDCDPLELRAESCMGVPGLVQAARSGQVVVANALGSGLLEAPALAVFLPEFAGGCLGEELQLPSVPTWWCGREQDLRYVEHHLDELVIRPAITAPQPAPILGLEAFARASGRIAGHDPRAAQPFRRPSASGMLDGSGLDRQRLAAAVSRLVAGVCRGHQRRRLRGHAGGLSRVSTNTDSLGESIAAGQASKDVWVLSDQPVATVTLLNHSATAIELRRSPNDLPSRVADHLYWLGRQVERAEGMVRHLRGAVVRMTNELEPAGMAELAVLVRSLYDEPEAKDLPPATENEDILAVLQADLLSFIFAQDRPQRTLSDAARAAQFGVGGARSNFDRQLADRQPDRPGLAVSLAHRAGPVG